MDVAYIAQLGDAQVLQWVEGQGPSFGFVVGGESPLEETYCDLMLRGQVPSLICDAVNDPRVRDLAVTRDAKIGAYLGVPIVLPDGQTYGSLCVLSHVAHPELDARNEASLRSYAGLVGQYLGAVGSDLNDQAEVRRRVVEVMNGRAVQAVFQPIVELHTRKVIGFEALARFPPPDGSPLRWFADAEAAGLRGQLELSAASVALSQLGRLPEDAFLALNFSPRVLAELGRVDLDALSERIPLARLVLELTEEAPVADYAQLDDALDLIRSRGARLAIDDAGAGYASMMHIVRLHPEFIKLDIAFVRGIDRDPSRRALAAALTELAARTGARVIAEGIETPAELAALIEIGVNLGQGYLLGRPAAL
jgi:EAL domain-containing protein (putative c-di-GMP-specific phosphodiesterase class I)